MALTKIGTDGVKDDAVTSDKVADSINTAIAANTAKTQTTINNNADNRVITGSGTANTLNAESNVVIDSSGNLAINSPSGSLSHKLQVESDSNANGIAILGRSSDDIGELSYYENDGSTKLGELQFRQTECNLRCRTGHMSFATGGSTERMRIESTGNIQIKRDKYIGTVASGQSSINIGTSGGAQIGFHQVSTNDDELRFYTHTSGSSHAERMRILKDGGVVINATSRPVVGTEFLGVQGGSANNSVGIAAAVSHNEGIPFFASNSSNSFSDRLMRFAAGSGGDTRGTITFNGSVMVYGGQSDYRLKENITSISDGITKLKNLNPINFNWIKDETNTSIMGFLAHEVQEVMPQVVVGTKDEVNSEGKPEYQEIDLGGISPLIVAALQEAITKIETLETKVAALEAA